ncbi:MAG: GNAT family protein [Sphaerochaetaceae bacterium]|nr:GNAT family protein [Sphaerochaetaceae bacterium]
MKRIEIKSKRLIIKDHIIDDLESYHQLISSKINMKYLPSLMSDSIEDTETTLLRIIDDSKNENRKMYYLGIFLKNNTYVGEIGYSVASEDLSGKKRVDLGYFIKEDFWNKGITSEAVRAVVDFAFNKNDVIKIELGCMAENIASEKVMIKCGFKKEAYKKKHSWMNRKWMDRVEYGMTYEDYESHKNG